MKTTILKLSILSLLTIAVGALQGQVHAQAIDKPAANKTESRKSGATPFHGKLKAVDVAARTITVGERMIQITSDTKIFKAGQPAALEDGVVGEEVGGAYQKKADGKLDATMVRFGPKPDQGPSGKETRPKEQ